jgi:excisionase family DNA binding protein
MEKLAKRKKPRSLLDAVSDNQIDDDTWMSFKEVCEYLSATESQIRSLVHRKKIPHCKLGRLLRFHRPAIKEWMFSNSQ